MVGGEGRGLPLGSAPFLSRAGVSSLSPPPSLPPAPAGSKGGRERGREIKKVENDVWGQSNETARGFNTVIWTRRGGK